MSIKGSVFTVDGTVTKLAEASGMPLEVHLHCASGSVYLGDSTVTTATGFKFDNGDKETFTVPDGSAIYGICNGGTTSTVYVLTAVL